MATITVIESGGDYNNLTDAITNANSGDTIEISGTWTSAETAHYTIPTSKNLTISAVGSSKHPGYVGSSPTHWRARPTSSGHTFTISSNLTLGGLDVSNQSTGESDEVIRINANGISIECDSCLLWFGSRNSEQDIIYTNSKDDYSILLTNCIIWNAYRSVIDDYDSNGTNTVDINSCSIYDIGFSAENPSRSGLIGVFANSSATTTCSVFNSLIHINTGYAFTTTTYGTTSITCDRSITNVSDFTSTEWDSESITDCFISHNWTDDDSKSSDGDWVIVDDITTSPYDFRLATNDYNEAQDTHADSSGAGLSIPSVDIIGTSRPQNTNYDVGAFEFVSSSGVTLSFLVINSNSVLNNDFLSAIRLLNPNNLNCFTEISDIIISGLVNIIQGNDISDESQITQASVQAIRKLLGQEISSLSQITEISLQAARKVGLVNIEALTEVTTIVFSVIRKLVGNDLINTTQITNPTIDIIKTLASNNLLNNTKVIDIVITVLKQISITSIYSENQITECILSVANSLNFANLVNVSQISNSIISVIKQIKQNNQSVSLQITNLVLSTLRGIKEENLVISSQITDVDITKIKTIISNNVILSTQILDIAIGIVRKININHVSSISDITDVVLSITGNMRGVNLEIQTEITSIVLTIFRALKQNNIEANSIIGGITLQSIKYLPFIDISSSSELTTIVLNSAGSLGVTDNNIISQITNSLLYVIRAFSPINIDIQSDISDPVISVLRNVYSAIVNIPSSVSNIGLSIVGVTVIGKVTVTFSMAIPGVDFSMNTPGIGWEVE